MPRTPPDTNSESTLTILMVEDERLIALNLKDYTIQGMGMGLAIVEKAVNLHGGILSFESEAGVGTTVLVTLPGC